MANDNIPIIPSVQVIKSVYILLMNYIRLTPGVPTRMHFTDDYIVERDIPDKETGKPKRVRSLVFWCDRLEATPCAKTFSVLSDKLAAHLEPFRKDKEYTKYEFIITEVGDGFLKDWVVQPIRLEGVTKT